MKKLGFILVLSTFLFACSSSRKSVNTSGGTHTSAGVFKANSKAKAFTQPLQINRNDFVKYARTLLGTPYKYASSIPSKGLDCSGFVYNVFNNFNVKAPRSSKDFTNEGQTISENQAQPGDLILFTGSDNSSGIVGHMGIITSPAPKLQFIHSASGKNIGVIINDFQGYYKTHFVKIIRVLQ